MKREVPLLREYIQDVEIVLPSLQIKGNWKDRIKAWIDRR
jgi:hypothetical protein